MRGRRVAGLMAIGGILLLIAIALGFVAIKANSNPTNVDGNTPSVQLLGLALPIVDPEPVAPSLYVGVPHTAPSFDTSGFGPDLSLQQDLGGLVLPDSDEILTAVYVGDDVNGDPYFIWLVGSRNLFAMLGQVVADFGAWGRIGTSYGSLITGKSVFDEPVDTTGEGVPHGSIRGATGQPTILTAEWFGLPDSVTAVVFYNGAEPIGWQRPISGTVAIQQSYTESLDAHAQDKTMVALTAEGTEWSRIVLFPANPTPFEHPPPSD